MTDLPTIIKARFLEAADTERRLPYAKVRPDGYGSSMPSYLHDFADRVGWGKDRLEEERRSLSRRLPPTAAAISRHDECLRWTVEEIAFEPYRRAIWGWALCRASSRSFRGWCRTEGVSHETGYRRVDAVTAAISSKFRKSSHLLMRPADEWLLHIDPDWDINSDMVGDSTGRSLGAWRAADADPATSDDPAVARLLEAQRRRREKLGLVA